MLTMNNLYNSMDILKALATRHYICSNGSSRYIYMYILMPIFNRVNQKYNQYSSSLSLLIAYISIIDNDIGNWCANRRSQLHNCYSVCLFCHWWEWLEKLFTKRASVQPTSHSIAPVLYIQITPKWKFIQLFVCSFILLRRIRERGSYKERKKSWMEMRSMLTCG